MAAPLQDANDELFRAATVAFTLLRFETGAAHPFRGATPPGMLRIGEQAYQFSPSWRSVPLADVPAFLAGLRAPALLSPTTTRGMIALTLLDELSGERAAWAKKTLSNQSAGLERMIRQLALADDATILLEFDDETHLIPLTVLRCWSQQFAVQVGWSLSSISDDARAAARMNLFRSDGHDSLGSSCPTGSG